MRRPKQAAAIWSRIQRREWDVLVGTQLVLRHDVVPPVGLVGVVQADAGSVFRIPEPPNAPIIFCTTPSVLRSRSRWVDSIILQTYLPFSSYDSGGGTTGRGTLPNGRNGTPNRARISSGRSLDRAACLRSAGRDRRTSRSNLGRSIGSYGQKSGVQRGNSRSHQRGWESRRSEPVLGPALSPVPRLRGRYRRQILAQVTFNETGGSDDSSVADRTGEGLFPSKGQVRRRHRSRGHVVMITGSCVGEIVPVTGTATCVPKMGVLGPSCLLPPV